MVFTDTFSEGVYFLKVYKDNRVFGIEKFVKN
jgi:hypothetical protein